MTKRKKERTADKASGWENLGRTRKKGLRRPGQRKKERRRTRNNRKRNEGRQSLRVGNPGRAGRRQGPRVESPGRARKKDRAVGRPQGGEPRQSEKERWGGWHGARVANPGSKKEECEIKPRVTPTARKKEEKHWGTYQGNRVNSRLSLALSFWRPE